MKPILGREGKILSTKDTRYTMLHGAVNQRSDGCDRTQTNEL
jgi:hypothetical protein